MEDEEKERQNNGRMNMKVKLQEEREPMSQMLDEKDEIREQSQLVEKLTEQVMKQEKDLRECKLTIVQCEAKL